VRLVLDACVLYPPVLRRILFGLAEADLIVPLWSERILREWAQATVKLGPEAEAAAQVDALLARAAFPRATVPPAPGIEARLVLPDPNDVHVLATAIAGGADAILTFNAADFPRHVLAAEGLARRDPDGFLWELWSHHPEAVARVLDQVRADTEAASGRQQTLPRMLRRLRLNRLAKALG
jgi:predicted nucleic acid-binding protein